VAITGTQKTPGEAAKAGKGAAPRKPLAPERHGGGTNASAMHEMGKTVPSFHEEQHARLERSRKK